MEKALGLQPGWLFSSPPEARSRLLLYVVGKRVRGTHARRTITRRREHSRADCRRFAVSLSLSVFPRVFLIDPALFHRGASGRAHRLCIPRRAASRHSWRRCSGPA